jgi:hypothetical protein
MGVITSDFSRRIVGASGTNGPNWLDDLQRMLNEIGAKWSIEIDSPFLPLSYNYVASATMAEGTRVVLKAGVALPILSGPR